MKLKDIADKISCGTSGGLDAEISNLSIDSKAVTPGDLFICIRGQSRDGHSYHREALFNGARALVTEVKLDSTLPQLIVADSRRAMTEIAEIFYGYPAKKLKMIGITGTNGKTTTSYMIKSILEADNKSVGVIGTLGIYYANKKIAPELTTPDPICLNRTLSDMVQSGVKYVVMEVSAHAIYFNKTGGTVFDIGILTNITQDHLDFFGTFEKYKAVKASFFSGGRIRAAVLNFDDESAQQIAQSCDVPYVSYAFKNPSDVFAIDIKQMIGGSSFVINLFDDICDINLKLLGEFNVSNALSAAAACRLLGVETEAIAKGLYKLGSISGRLEYVGNYNGGDIFVDFAHTPDGLKKILTSLKAFEPKRLICLFGCGGNRDKTKRPLMGGVVAENSDFCVLTSDNPRFEDPLDIISDIEKGIREVSKNYVVVQDRKSAIEYAVKMLETGDILVIAGKGGENYQEIMGIKHTYNDNDAVKGVLEKLERNV